MSAEYPVLFIAVYCKTEVANGVMVATYARAYKYLNPIEGKTPTVRHFVYSHKAKKYVLADFYICDWKGSQANQISIERDVWRWSLRRIGLDIR